MFEGTAVVNTGSIGKARTSNVVLEVIYWEGGEEGTIPSYLENIPGYTRIKYWIKCQLRFPVTKTTNNEKKHYNKAELQSKEVLLFYIYLFDDLFDNSNLIYFFALLESWSICKLILNLPSIFPKCAETFIIF